MGGSSSVRAIFPKSELQNGNPNDFFNQIFKNVTCGSPQKNIYFVEFLWFKILKQLHILDLANWLNIGMYWDVEENMGRVVLKVILRSYSPFFLKRASNWKMVGQNELKLEIQEH